ncbi:hypothetical protein BH10ACT1_BH10ACT1_33520 [soil metagenome]
MARRFWTDQQLIDFLREAAEATGQPLRYGNYRNWAAGHEDRPSPDTIVRCLGPWVIALAAADLQVDRRRGVYRLPPPEAVADD